MSMHMNFNEDARTEVDIDDGEVTLWIRSADRSQVVSLTLTEQQRMNLIEMLQSPKEVDA